MIVWYIEYYTSIFTFCQKLKEGRGFGSPFLERGGGGGDRRFAVSENKCMQCNPMVLMQERVVGGISQNIKWPPNDSEV